LNLFFIPVLYVIFKVVLEKITPKRHPGQLPAGGPPVEATPE
jgi:hypothetical protein